MSIASDMFKNADGRLAPGAFLKSALILIAIGFVFSLLPLFGLGMAGGAVGTVLSLVLLIPWVIIWIKRLHDAGLSGWLFLVFLAIYIVASLIVSTLVTRMFGPDMSAIASSTDFTAVMQAAQQAGQQTALPNAVGSAAISLITVFVANLLLRSEPGPNRFGEPPAQ